MLPALFAAALAAQPAPAMDPAQQPATLTARVSDPKVIRAAVREAIAGDAPVRGQGTVLSGDAHPGFTRAVDEARVPDCLHPDAMKHQPPKIGVVGIGGILALPFWLTAIVRGKCN